MNHRTFLSRTVCVAGVALVLIAGCAPARRRRPHSLNPHVTPITQAMRTSHVEEKHEVVVKDPYRWLEELDSPNTRSWIEEQNAKTADYMADTERDLIRERLQELWNYEKTGIPRREGGRYFFTRNDGLQNQSVLYSGQSVDSATVLLDPNQLSADATVALRSWSPSPNGRLLAYALSSGGSDWREWHVLDVESGETLPDHLKWSKFSGASWSGDSTGFFYSRYERPRPGKELKSANYYQKLYYHKLGTPQGQDTVVHKSDEHKEWGFGGTVTDDGRYLVISVWRGTSQENNVSYKDLSTPGAPVTPLMADWDASYEFVGNTGDVFFFKTDLDAPRGRVVAVDLKKPGKSHWKQIVRQTKDTLRSVSYVGEHLIGSYLSHAQSKVRVFTTRGKFVRDVDLADIGTARGFGGRADQRETFYTFSSFTTPPTVYRYDVPTGVSSVVAKPKVKFERGVEYVTKQVFYKSADGTRVPMFLVHRKDVRADGKRPTYLYGYGGFNIALTPSFSPSRMAWIEKGGLFAMPNIRGGGEYGEEWHKAGTKLDKQNTFDDFIAAAEWLVKNNYTRRDRLCIAGGSNGGLLVGACMTQRPDLFGVCVASVGVFDMLRFHKFTIGWAWTSDYGDPENEAEFHALKRYSPLHNLRPGTNYPSTLLTTGDHDDRVVPAHSYKFAAALQSAQGGSDPILIRIDTRAGHGAGTPTSKILDRIADQWAFVVREMGLDY